MLDHRPGRRIEGAGRIRARRRLGHIAGIFRAPSGLDCVCHAQGIGRALGIRGGDVDGIGRTQCIGRTLGIRPRRDRPGAGPRIVDGAPRGTGSDSSRAGCYGPTARE